MGSQCTCMEKEDEIEINSKKGLLKLKKVRLDRAFEKELELQNQKNLELAKLNGSCNEIENKKEVNIDKLRTNETSKIIPTKQIIAINNLIKFPKTKKKLRNRDNLHLFKLRKAYII